MNQQATLKTFSLKFLTWVH